MRVAKGECADPPLAGNELDTGTLEQGAHTIQRICVENASSEQLTLTRFTSTCDCLSLDPLPAMIRAGGSRPMELRIDLRNDPKFAGDLAIELSAFDARSIKRLELVVLLKVRKTIPAAPHGIPGD